MSGVFSVFFLIKGNNVTRNEVKQERKKGHAGILDRDYSLKRVSNHGWRIQTFKLSPNFQTQIIQIILVRK